MQRAHNTVAVTVREPDAPVPDPQLSHVASRAPRRLRTNTAAQYLSLVAQYAFSFVLAPIMLARLGLTQFGVWAVTGALAQYAGFLDFGITRALARYVALHRWSDSQLVGETIGVGLLVVSLLTVVMLGAAFASGAPVHALLGASVTVHQTRILLVSAVVIFATQGYVRVAAAYPTGSEDMIAPNIAVGLYATVNFLFSLASLVYSRSLVTYAYANALAGVVSVAPAIFVIWRASGGLPIRMPSRTHLSAVWRYGVAGQLPWLSDIINYQTDKVVIAALVDVRAAGAYELVNRVAAAVKQMATYSTSAMVPMATRLIATGGREAARTFAQRYMRPVGEVSFPLFFGVVAASPALIAAWLGAVPPRGILILVGLSMAYVFAAPTSVMAVICFADGRQRLANGPGIASAAANIVLTATLGEAFGLVGVLSGTVLALGIGAAFGTFVFCRAYDLRVRDLAQTQVRPLLASASLCAAILPLASIVGSDAGRPTSLAIALAALLTYVLGYAALMGRVGVIAKLLHTVGHTTRSRVAGRRADKPID